MAKLNKQLLQGLHEAGFETLTDLQDKLVSRVSGGAALYVTEPEVYRPAVIAEGEKINLSGCPEKLMGLMVAILQKLNYSQPDTPRAVALAATPEDAETLYSAFSLLAKHMDLRIHLAHENGHLDDQNSAIYSGADLVIATPKRLLKLYFQCGINVNRTNVLILYRASRIVDNRLNVEINRFVESLSKFQPVVYTEELNEKVKKACAKFMFAPVTI